VELTRHERVKLLITGAVASAFVAVGAVAAVAVGQQQTGIATGDMTIGETVTKTTPPSVPETTKATPPVTATPPDGF
jgi:ABC-type uncharacterized transport system substrate-binding protein